MDAERTSVLVVDDDEQLGQTVCDILRLHGIESVAAHTGAGGLELASTSEAEFSVALIDLRLPDMYGLDVVAKLHDIAEFTEIVVLTGNASLDSAIEALRENSFDYLVKPVAPDLLVSTVQRGFRRWRHRRAEEELLRDRERFQLVVEALSDVVTVVLPDGTIQYQSPSAQRVLGYDPGSLASHPFVDHVHPAEVDAVRAALRRAEAGAGPARAFEFRFQRSDGAWALLEGAARRLHERGDSPIVVTSRDITERRRLERELSQAQKMETIGRLAGGIAHDFNNQLTAILSAARLASWHEGLPTEVHEELEEILRAAQRSARLTQQLLIFSRKDIEKPTTVVLKRIVEDMASMLRRLLPDNLELVLDLSQDLASVHVDATQMEQVLLNLVVNARDAMSGTSGQLVIRTALRPADPAELAEGDYGEASDSVVVLEVVDQGHGMTSDVAERVFEPFFTTKDPERGTGLGLATTYGIVKRAGGSIRVHSSPGAGTTFEVRLPLSTAPTEPKVFDRSGVGTGKAEATETILLVEDDPAVRRGLGAILERAGYRVLSADGGREALRLLREAEERPDLLVTDLVMPELSGPEVASRVLEEHPDVPVLYMSGYVEEEIRAEGGLPYGGDLVQKPVLPEDFLSRVRQALEGTEPA
jgi:PAS domain S-box-containing protein